MIGKKAPTWRVLAASLRQNRQPSADDDRQKSADPAAPGSLLRQNRQSSADDDRQESADPAGPVAFLRQNRQSSPKIGKKPPILRVLARF